MSRKAGRDGGLAADPTAPTPRGGIASKTAPKTSPKTIPPTGGTGTLAVLALLLLTVFACAFQTLVSADYWFHLRAGADVARGHIPRADAYSFPSAGRPYIDLHWIFQLLLYGVHRLGGVALAIWAQCLIVAATFWLLFRLARREAEAPIAGFAAGLGVILASERYLVRPELLTFLFLALALWLARRHTEGWRPAWLLFPLLFAVWTNVEGLFVIGFAVLAAAILDRPRDRRLWAALGLSLLATLANPWFVRGALHPLVLYSRINGSIAVYSTSIAEFRGPFDPATRHPATYLFPWFLALLVLALALSRRPRAGEIALLAVFTFLSFRARRNLGLLAVVSVPILARWLSLAGERLRATRLWRRTGPGTRRRVAAGAGAAIVLAFLLFDASLVTGRFYARVESNRSFGAGEGLAAFSWPAARFLSRNRIEGPLYTTLSLGSFLIWSDPQAPVFVDGRLEVHSTAHFARCLQIRSGGEAWRAADRDYRFNALAIDYLEAPQLALERMQDPEWAWVEADSRAVVFLRRTAANAPLIAANELDRPRLSSLFPPLGAAPLLPPPASWLVRRCRPVRLPWDHLNPGQLLMWAGAPDLAAEQFREAAFEAPDLPSPRLLLSSALCQLDRGADAMEALASTSGLPASAADRRRLLALRGDVLLSAGRTRDAVAAYTTYLAHVGRSPESAAPLVNRALAWLDLGNASAAASDAREALDRNPGYAEAWRVLGRAEEGRQDQTAALQAYRRYVDLGGRAPEARAAIARLQAADSAR